MLSPGLEYLIYTSVAFCNLFLMFFNPTFFGCSIVAAYVVTSMLDFLIVKCPANTKGSINVEKNNLVSKGIYKFGQYSQKSQYGSLNSASKVSW